MSIKNCLQWKGSSRLLHSSPLRVSHIWIVENCRDLFTSRACYQIPTYMACHIRARSSKSSNISGLESFIESLATEDISEKALHEKWSFPLRISSANVTNCGFWSHLLKKSLKENFNFCTVKLQNLTQMARRQGVYLITNCPATSGLAGDTRLSGVPLCTKIGLFKNPHSQICKIGLL